MSPWGWQPERTLGIWRYGAPWIRPLVAAAPYLTVILLLGMLYLINGTYAMKSGMSFELPASSTGEELNAELVALVMRMPKETLVFFDDSRYLVDDASSRRAFQSHLAGRVSQVENKTLLVLADRTVSSGELMELMSEAKQSGVAKVLVAERRSGQGE